MLLDKLRRGKAFRCGRLGLAVIVFCVCILGGAYAGTGSDGQDPCVPPNVPVRAHITLTNNTGQTANDLHFYMYQSDRPGVEVVGASASSGAFGNVGVGLDSNNNKDVPPGVGPPYHGANVDMSGGSVPPGGPVTIDVTLCMTEKNVLKICCIEWTTDGEPIDPPDPGVNGGWRLKNPAPGGGGGNPDDPSGGGSGAQGGGGGSGNYVHIVCIENDDDTYCMRVNELKLLASMSYYTDLAGIDWGPIKPIKNDKNEPPAVIPPLGRWCYYFETTGSYVGGHVYMRLNAERIPCGKALGPKQGGDPPIEVGDHPVTALSTDSDWDTLWDEWEEVYDLDTTDDGSGNPDNGPTGDPDSDGFTNCREQTLLSDPQDPSSPPAVQSGYDLLLTLATVSLVFDTPQLPPIPADFFGPGSDPFSGTITLQGYPLPTSPECPGNLGATDTIVKRDKPAALPGVPSSDMIGIEIVGLSLVSASPITVTYGGTSPTMFNVSVTVNPMFPSHGALRIDKTHGNGGTFEGFVQFLPQFTFTQVDNPSNVIERFGPDFGVQDSLQISDAPWEHLAPELACPDCVSNFVPGHYNGAKHPFTLVGELVQLVLEPSCPEASKEPTDVRPGADLLRVTGTAHVEFGYGLPPIPACFFDPGSEPFYGEISLRGGGIDRDVGCPPESTGAADVVVRRLGPANLTDPGSSATIPIEIVALSLVSVNPIRVVSGPKIDSFFDVFVEVSLAAPSTGSMTVTKTHANGGTFSSELFIAPRFTFREVDNPSNEHVLDEPTFIRQVRVSDVPWIDDSSGLQWPSCASNFVPGVEVSSPKSIVGTKAPFIFAGVGASLPLEPVDFSTDTDGDGLSDFDEAALGTDPNNRDSDGDGLPDGWEHENGLNPLSATGDDGRDGDPDGDGVSNQFEYMSGTDPQDPTSAAQVPVALWPAALVLFGIGVALTRRRT